MRKFYQAQNPGIILTPLFHLHSNCLKSSLQGISGLQSLSASEVTFSTGSQHPSSGREAPVVWVPTTALTSPTTLLPLMPSNHTGLLVVPHISRPCTHLRTYLFAVFISSLPSGPCSNIISSERPPSAPPSRLPTQPWFSPFFFFFFFFP